MQVRILKSTAVSLLILITAFNSLSQQHNPIKNDEVKLLKWNASSCNNTYDPYRLKNRITQLETRGDSTIITVNFSDNCCAGFKPKIVFAENKLTLLPYEKYLGEYCTCNCCFSIEFEISGLAGKEYEVYFKENKVELSGDHYKVVEPKDTLYNGVKINRTNKYGFKEGVWITFYKTGEKKSISQYPDDLVYYDSRPFWYKGYYASGALSQYSRNDTSESWFEDGEIKSQFIKYSSGDTTYDSGFRKYENRNLEKKYFKKSYPIVFKSDLNPEYESQGNASETIYEEEYYTNGKLKYEYGDDTTYAWHENGQLKYKSYESGKIKYDEDGIIEEKSFDRFERGPDDWGDLGNFLQVYFYKNGNIKEIEFVRDEVFDHGSSMSRFRYYWKWDIAKKMTEKPKKWKGDYPWERFKEINLVLKTYELH